MTRREKRRPLGVCDHCGHAIPHDLWYTTKGQPRLYCGLDCKNTANSRAGARLRGEKARQRVARGEWVNPRAGMSRLEIAEHNQAAAHKGRLREVEAGTWRNPALTAAARAKLSRPRKHNRQPLLHRAFELMRQGVKARDLPPEVNAAHKAYRRKLAQRARTSGGV